MSKTTKHIVIVEDDNLLAQMYRMRLTSANYQVSLAIDDEALQKRLKRCLPDLILLDIILPGKNGLQILKDLRSRDRTASVPVIMLSNLARADAGLTPELAQSLGIFAYLVKPHTTTDQLLAAIDLCLGAKR